jgi:ribulose-bisphosphate carboxylase large chain
MAARRPLAVSGTRFTVRYHLSGTEAEAREAAEAICYEQTVEVPDAVVPAGDIREHILGRVEQFGPLASGSFEAAISFAVEIAGRELPQLLNVLYGNISIKPGVRLARLELPAGAFSWLKGPRFGAAGLRERLGAPSRPLLCAPLKPMGLSPTELADLAYQFALGGVDIIKDDHGLADQPFCPFQERVPRCADAAARANQETGGRCLYAPNVTAQAGATVSRSLFAKRAGAGGLLISPGLTGWDTLREIADDDRIGLPILSHPALLGSFVTDRRNGISHGALFGQFPRLAGADATIFPSFGGRFSFTRADCCSIAESTGEPMAHFRPIFPVPGGGISLDRLPELCELYGSEVIFLVGGALRQGSDLIESCRTFLRRVADPTIGRLS